MGRNRDLVFSECYPPKELAFSLAEYGERLMRIRQRMAKDDIDLLWMMAPESLYYVSGYTCEWYQAQSPKQWPATSGIAVHADHDKFILFDTPSEAIMCRFMTFAQDIRIFPMDSRRDGVAFIIDELRAEGWLKGAVAMEFHSYRPNPAISARFRAAFSEAGCSVTDGTDVLREARWRKSPQEIAYIEKAGGENPAITLPVLSGLKANTGHSLASRKMIEAGEQVNVDVCGVYHRYHANGARSFYVGEPPSDVLAYHDKSSGVFSVIEDMLKPNLPVAELVRRTREYYEDMGIWSDAGWVGGYELGIAFPPDWVGNFVYEMSDVDSDRIFEPGTVVNFESQFFSPRMSGITYYIDTLLFKQGSATLPIRAPRRLVSVG